MSGAVDRLIAAAQLALTLVVLAFVPTNPGKLLAFLAVWGITFRRLTRRELLCFCAICILFSLMDIAASAKGAFRFSHPDLAGVPVWEFFMWGFYVLHVIKMIGGPPPSGDRRVVLGLALITAIPFITITDPTLLLLVSSAALVLALAFFHERYDWAYFGYMIFVGAAVEYLGTWKGLWSYPSAPLGGVEFWFVTMWGGVGLFARRLALPLLRASQPPSL
jgi:hypothetical protein